MAVRAQDVAEGTELEVLWLLEEEERLIFWPAVVETVHDRPNSSVKATIVYKSIHGHPETRSEVLICDGVLVEKGVSMRWRRLGDADDGAGQHEEQDEHEEHEEQDDHEKHEEQDDHEDHEEQGEHEVGEIIDDPTRSAVDVVQTGLACAMMDRPIEEQRVLAERLSRALETFRGEMQTVLEGMAPGEEVDNTIAEAIVKRLSASTSL
jgi:hypothetical protein